MNKLNDLNFLRNETYNQRKIALFAILSVCLGIYFTLVSYPGVMYTDSYNRLNMAKAILDGMQSFNFSNINSWISITPSFFMAFLYAFTNNFASFTLVQAVLFFFSSFLMIDKFVSHYKTAAVVLFIICPIFYSYSIFYEMSVGSVIGINFGLLLLFGESLKDFKSWKTFHKLSYFAALFICFYIAFGFRQNAFTIAPVIIAIPAVYFYKKYKNKLLFVLQIAAVLFSLIFVSLFPYMLGIKVLDSSSSGFVWEILSVIQEMPEDKQKDYGNYLDFIADDGSTLKALAANNKSASVNRWQWDIFGVSKLGSKNIKKEILRRYANLIIHEPKYCLKTKLYFTGRTLGITEPLADKGFDYNRADRMQSLGMVDNKLRRKFVDGYNKFQDFFVISRIPWICFLIGLLCVIWQFIKADRKHFSGTLTLYLIAVFYYGAFIINTQSFEFRYFFPSFYFLFIITADTVFTIIRRYMSKDVFKDIHNTHIKVILKFLVIAASAALIFIWPISKFYGASYILDVRQVKQVCVWAIFQVQCASHVFNIWEIRQIYSGYTRQAHGDIALHNENIRQLKRIRSKGILLYNDKVFKIYYYESALYYITDKKTDVSARFFLHLYPENLNDTPDKRVQYWDFSFVSNEMLLPSSKAFMVAKINLPNYAIKTINTGQFIGKERLWSHSIRFPEYFPSKDSINSAMEIRQ